MASAGPWPEGEGRNATAESQPCGPPRTLARGTGGSLRAEHYHGVDTPRATGGGARLRGATDDYLPSGSCPARHHEERVITARRDPDDEQATRTSDLDHSNTVRAGVFGIQDGVVSNFGLIMGVAGAQISPAAVLIAGVAGLVSGAMSMGAGEYVSVRTQRELLEVNGVVGDEENVNPIRAAAANASLFATGGFVPLLPFLLTSGAIAVLTSVLLSIGVLFAAGAVLTRLTRRSPVVSGLRVLAIGGGAGLLGYLVGSLLGGAVG